MHAAKLIFNIESRMILPALFGRYGIANNKQKNLENLNELSGMFFSEGADCSCDAAIDYFKQRNQRIARNLGTQISASEAEKNVLVIGAAHVVGLKEELQKQFPDINVITINELKKSKKHSKKENNFIASNQSSSEY